MHVIIMSGISGSGKDTYLKQRFPHAFKKLSEPMIDELIDEGMSLQLICSADHFFEKEGSYKFDVSKLNQAHGECLRDFIDFVQYGFENENDSIIIVNNTNTTNEEIAPYYSIAKAYGATVELVTLVLNPEKAAARNVHNVPLTSCQAMAKRLNQRKLPPFWKFSSEAIIPTD